MQKWIMPMLRKMLSLGICKTIAAVVARKMGWKCAEPTARAGVVESSVRGSGLSRPAAQARRALQHPDARQN